MPNLIADKIMQYVNRIGEPVKSTSTTTQEEAPGIDLGNIMMMLYLTNAFKKPGGAGALGPDIGSVTGIPGPMNTGGGFGGSGLAPGGLGGGGFGSGNRTASGLEGMDMQKILEILKSLGGLIR